MKFNERMMIEEYDLLNESGEVEKYIRRIKNKGKKEYAQRYYKWKKGKEKGESPDRGSLGTMGAQAVRMQIDDMMDESIINEAPIKAKGWSQKSIAKFEETIGKKADEKGFFDACVNRMKKHMGDKAEGFCASLKDAKYNSPQWRGKDKTEKEVEKDTSKNQYSKSKRLPKYRKNRGK
jgi:hypothetical protein